MNKIILHIGTNKTGTSSLQVFLRENEQLLDSNFFIYPSFTGEVAHHDLAKCFSKLNTIYDDGNYAEKTFFYLTEIKKLFKKKPNHTIILSSEAFTQHFNPAGVKKILEDFEVEVICYYREYVGYFSSWYQQDICGTNYNECFIDFCKKNFVRANYLKSIPRWIKSFGKNFKYRAFDRSILLDNDIVSDFCSIIGMQYPRKSHFYSNNESIAGNLFFIKKCLNNHISLEESLEIVEGIQDLCSYYDDWYPLFSDRRDESRSFKGKLPLSEKEISFVHKHYIKNVKRLESKFNLKLNLSTSLKGPTCPNINYLKEDFDLILKESKRSQPHLLEYFSRININDYI